MAESYLEHVHYFESLVHCAYEVPFWELGADLEMETEITPENELLSYFFRFSDASKSLKEYAAAQNPMPLLISNSVMLLWAAAFRYEKGKLQKVILMGPVYMNEASPKKIRELIDRGDQPLDIRRKVTQALNRIPILPSSDLFQYTLMLHYAVTGEKISFVDIQHGEKRPVPGGYLSAAKKVREVMPDPGSPEAIQDSTHQGVLSIDQQLLEIVRTGNLHYGDIFSRAGLVSKGIRTHRGDAMRGYKNSVIQFIGLCSRAAIQGGMPAPLAYTLSDTYTDLVEGCSSITELTQLNHTMFEDFVRRVHYYQSDSSLSRPVRTACDYISLHLDGDLSLGHLAEMTGYTAYYLSRKFKKETGMSPADYINKTKTERARLMLDTSTASIQEISDELQFKSRSYFTTVFQKYVGCSPTEYRTRKKG